MTRLYRDRGVVLRTIKLGEADRIVTILTQGHGKVRAVAKGVRKTTSKFGSRLEPTSHVAVQLYQGRDLDVVTQVETIEANRHLRENYACVTHAITMLEAADQVAFDREPYPALYRMLTGALRTLSERPSALVAPAFLWKLLSLEGFHPVLDQCSRCGTEDETATFASFDLYEGGVLCSRCAMGSGRRLTPDTVALLTQILGGSLNDALATPPSAAASEVEHLGIAAIEHHLERRLRSASLL